jgi:hypothetical protein
MNPRFWFSGFLKTRQDHARVGHGVLGLHAVASSPDPPYANLRRRAHGGPGVLGLRAVASSPHPPTQTSAGAHTVGVGFSADGAVLEPPPSKPPGACLFLTPMVCLAGSGKDFDPTLGRLIFWGLGSSITSSRSPMGRTGAAGPSPVLDAVGAGLASLPRAPAWHGWGMPPLPLPVGGARRPALCCLHRNVENGATVSMAACDGSCEAPPRATVSGHRSAPEN